MKRNEFRMIKLVVALSLVYNEIMTEYEWNKDVVSLLRLRGVD